jgi:dTDP-4-dehydrorhamnose reductase
VARAEQPRRDRVADRPRADEAERLHCCAPPGARLWRIARIDANFSAVQTALVVGGDSRIGRALARALAEDGHAVIATTRRRNGCALDLAEVARTGAADLPACDVAFVCAAVSSYAACRSDERTARAVNVDAPAAIARALRARGAHLVFLSTNAVFDGEKPFRRADEQPNGATAYGRSKADAEALVRAIDPDAAVLRLTRVFSPGEPLLAGWMERLRAGGEVDAFADMVAAPVALGHAVSALCAIARDRARGILQLSARSELSYLEIARYIAERIGAPADRVRAVSAFDRGVGPGEAPRYASLACGEFLGWFGLAPIDPLDVIDASLELGSRR